MKYYTWRKGSKRSSAGAKTLVLKTMATEDGSNVYPILYFLVGDKWHEIVIENEEEAKILLSSAAKILKSFG